MKEGKYIKKSMSQLGYASSFEFGSELGVIVKLLKKFGFKIWILFIVISSYCIFSTYSSFFI